MRTPSLSFTIERHGATVVGSTRAELQNWTVNLDSASAYHSEGRFRQLVRQAPRLDVKSIVARVCDAVQQGPRSECDLVRKGIVFWSSEGEVIIKHGALVPGDGYRQTVAGRRRRFRQELAAKMSERGWKLRRVQRSMTFVRASVNEPPPATDNADREKQVIARQALAAGCPALAASWISSLKICFARHARNTQPDPKCAVSASRIED